MFTIHPSLSLVKSESAKGQLDWRLSISEVEKAARKWMALRFCDPSTNPSLGVRHHDENMARHAFTHIL